jgi:hypothetical protein
VALIGESNGCREASYPGANDDDLKGITIRLLKPFKDKSTTSKSDVKVGKGLF